MSDVEPAIQVIILGSGGGPVESNTTAFLLRSLTEPWTKGSILAVDAGIHLSGIASILTSTSPPAFQRQKGDNHVLTSGPFAGLRLPFINAHANAGHVVKNLVDTYLITHAHLDHISGLIVNTAALPGTRPKRIAALPTTIHAFKQHIFNNVIWPNLSDEGDGAGLLTYMRLVEGGSPALGPASGDERAKGYTEVCEGLSVKTWSVSHGHCMENHWHRGSSVGLGAHAQHVLTGVSHDVSFSSPGIGSPARRQSSNPHLLGMYLGANNLGHESPRPYFPSHMPSGDKVCVYDSSAYFIRDISSSREVLIFGDVEPDSISLSPRNHQIWTDSAPKIVRGDLRAIFIECSYDERQSDDTLFGHLCPRFLMEELQALATQVAVCKLQDATAPGSGSAGSENRPASREGRRRKWMSTNMILTQASGSERSNGSKPATTWSREASQLGLEVDANGKYVARTHRRTISENTSGHQESSGIRSGLLTPDVPTDGASTELKTSFVPADGGLDRSQTPGSGTRREALRHRQSSSVSPHSRPLRRKENANSMNIDVFEMDEGFPTKDFIIEETEVQPDNLPTTTIDERESEECYGDTTPTNSDKCGLRNKAGHARAFPEFNTTRTHIFPEQALPHNSLHKSHEPSTSASSQYPTVISQSTANITDRATCASPRDSQGGSVDPYIPGTFDGSASQRTIPSADGSRSPLSNISEWAGQSSSTRVSPHLYPAAYSGGQRHHSHPSSPHMQPDLSSQIRRSSHPGYLDLGNRGMNANGKDRRPSTEGMLKGIKVVIIHVKERLDDEEPAGQIIIRELKEMEEDLGLGVEFVLAERGMSILV